jgi:hypothetical protein
MSDSPKTTLSIASKHGLTAALFFIICPLTLYLLQINLFKYNNLVSVAYFVILIVFIVFSIKAVKSEIHQGTITFAQAFQAGILTVMIAAFIFSIFNIIFYEFIATDLKEEYFAASLQAMQEQGLSVSDIEASMKFTKMFFSPLGLFIGIMLLYSFFGGLASLVASFFISKS